MVMSSKPLADNLPQTLLTQKDPLQGSITIGHSRNVQRRFYDSVKVRCVVCRRAFWTRQKHIRKHPLCSAHCQNRYFADRRREKRRNRGQPLYVNEFFGIIFSRKWRCTQCGESFKPSRADAKYCSAKCKQSAYRQRTAEEMKRKISKD